MVGMVQGLLRTIVLSVRHHYGAILDPLHPILGWAVRHTGWILTRCAMKENGMTSYRLLRGKDHRGIVVECAECMLFKLPGLQRKLASRWEKWVWLGKRNSTDEHILGTELGTTIARTVQRRPEEHRWSKDNFKRMDECNTEQPTRRRVSCAWPAGQIPHEGDHGQAWPHRAVSGLRRHGQAPHRRVQGPLRETSTG